VKVSVVLATYNGGRFLAEQLESLQAQSRRPDELVVCDDGSTDGTIACLHAFAERALFPVRIHENKANLGYAGNFSQAIGMAAGEIIFLCDQDDRWHHHKIEAYLQRFESEPALEAIFSDSALVNENLESLGRTLFHTNKFTEREKNWICTGEAWRAFLRHNVVAGNTLAFRARNRAMVLPVPPGWVHDAWISTLIAFRGKIGFLDSCTIDYRQHGSQNIGVLTGGPLGRFRARWRRAMDGSRKDCLAAAQAWRELLGRAPAVPENVKDRFVAKAKWLEARGRLPDFCLARIPAILANAPAYSEFDNGWQTMLKDLFIS
jgi:glycosyltransferase involved in cell wall biosynthesis